MSKKPGVVSTPAGISEDWRAHVGEPDNINSKDVARARKFYEEKLGFKSKQELAGGVVYEFGKSTGCFLYPTPNAGTSQAIT